MNFHHKEYYFSKKVVGLALLLCYSNKTWSLSFQPPDLENFKNFLWVLCKSLK
jgi:hypothetical protein